MSMDTKAGSSRAPTLAIVGGLALDNVIDADGRAHIGRAGGNTLWASAGAALFDESVGIVARVGADYPEGVLADFAAAGVDTTGVTRSREPHRLRIAYAHLPDGRRLQPVPTALLQGLPEHVRAQFVDTTTTAQERGGGDPQPADIPPGWLADVRGWHIPLVSLSAYRRLVDVISRRHPTWLIADCPNRHEITSWIADLRDSCPALTAFLPSTSDFEIIDPAADPLGLVRSLSAAAHVPVVLKRGGDGSLIVSPGVVDRLIPAIGVSVVDPTGAGDAFCGGFLAGLRRTGDLGQAASFATVAASFAVQTTNPLQVLQASRLERDRRLQFMFERIAPTPAPHDQAQSIWKGISC